MLHGKQVSRRDLLRLMGVGAVGAVIAACQPKVVQVTTVVEKVVRETVVVEKQAPVAEAPKGPKVVKIICHDWVRAEIPIDRLVTDYNQGQSDHQIVYERLVDGWETKALSAIRAGTSELTGIFQLTALYAAKGWANIGMIQPFDDYLSVSKAPGAGKLLEDMLPVVRGQCQLDGKLLAFPIDFDESGFGYRKDLFEAVGAKEFPGTWQEIGEVAKAISEKFKNDSIYGLSSAAAWFLYGGPGAIFYNTAEQVFDENSIIRYDSEEFIAALELCKSWADQDITAKPFGSLDSNHWIAGKVGIFWNQHPVAIWAQKNLGKTNVSDPEPMPLKEKGSGCLVWAICYGLANKAPYPQEFVDYLATTFYPGGEVGVTMNQAICASGKLPAYLKAYDEVVSKDPSLAWMTRMVEIAKTAAPPPMMTSASIQTDRQAAWSEKFFAGEIGAKEAMDNCIKEIKEEISKMKEEGGGRGT